MHCNNHFMNSKGSKRDKKSAKSAERKYSLHKNKKIQGPTFNALLADPKEDRPQQSLAESPPPSKITDRTKAKSCLGAPIDPQKVSLNMLIPLKKTSLSGWTEEQMKTKLVEKRSRNAYDYLHVIGKGGFGKVYKVKEKKTGSYFAMKQMSKAVILAKKSNESIRNERQLLRTIKHPFIVNMRQAFQDRDTLYLIMDLMPGGDLRYHICRKHKFTEEQTRFLAACIFLGLEYMHSQKIIHRDIKPENLVLDLNGYLHLTDLGIAKYYRESNCTDTSGTPGYMAPEVLTKQNHSYQVDYYALGVIVYQLMMGRRPYVGRDRKSIRQQIMAKQTVIKKNEIPEGWSIEAADFVNKLIQRRPIMRLGWVGAQQVRNHTWLRDFPWEKLLSGELKSPFKSYSKYNPEDVRYQPTQEDEELSNRIKENKILLRKSTVQEIFQGYTFDEQEQIKSEEHHTTSSEFQKKKDIEVVEL